MTRSTSDWPYSTPRPPPAFIPRIVAVSSGPWRCSSSLAGRSATCRPSTIGPRPPKCPSSRSISPVPFCTPASIAASSSFSMTGLVDEVQTLQAAPEPLCDVAAQAIGYREVIAMLAGEASKSRTIEQIQARTRQFAKRQMTWFRGLEEVHLVPIDAEMSPLMIAERLLRLIEAPAPGAGSL